MDGASYHKVVDPCFVPLYGRGGLYGPKPGGDKGSKQCGWTAKSCIAWLDVPQEQVEVLESESLLELRSKVEAQSTQTKF